jgi:hypothetical protein
MKILLLTLLGYAILFYMLKRTGIDDEPGETLLVFGELAPFLILGVQLANWLFGANFSDEAWVFIWIGLYILWTLLAIFALIYEPWKRRKRAREVRRMLYGED